MTLTPFDQALLRSAVYMRLSIGFERPDPTLQAHLNSEEETQGFIEALELLNHGTAAEEIQKRSKIIPEEEDYFRIFGHSSRGKVPPYETEYGGDTFFMQPQELSDLMGFLSAFGLKLNPEDHERIDHVRCECEFMSFLAEKEAYALEHGEETMLAQTQKAQELFLKDHLGRFASAFGARLRREDPDGFYGQMGKILSLFIRSECERFKIPLGAEDMGLRTFIPDSLPSCERNCEVGCPS